MKINSRLATIASIMLSPILAACATVPQGESFDLLLRGGEVVDGTGRPSRVTDVGVRGNKIVFVGDAKGRNAVNELDVSGLVVAPGFVDPHTHALEEIVRENRTPGPLINEGYLRQGVTTLVSGPDGYFSPKFMRTLDTAVNQYGSALNYAFYVGHNGIRREVMGGAQRRPTPTELDQMRDMVRDGMEMGAVGFSTGLMYEPGMFSGIDEVVELTKEVAPFNGVYDSHTRNPVFEMMASESEAIEVGRRAGVPAKLAHLKAVGLINRGKIGDVIQLVEASNRLGQQVVSDQYPYDGAATANLTDLIILPETGVGAASREAVLQALSDGGIASNSFAAVREASEKGIGGGFSWIKAVGYGSMRIVDAPDDPSLVGKNLFLLSQERGQSPFELVVSLIRENENPVLLTLGAIEEQDVRELLVQPWNMISSDGAYADAIYQEFKHPRSTGSFPRVLGYYVREEKVLTLEEAVRKMTSFPASFLGLSDRGVLSPGFAADITVFDKNRIIDKSTWTDPGAYSEGVVHVIVNGKFVLRNEQVTGQTPGEWVKPNR